MVVAAESAVLRKMLRARPGLVIECYDWLIISAMSRGFKIGIVFIRNLLIFPGQVALQDPFPPCVQSCQV